MPNKHLYLFLKEKVKKWREMDYFCNYPTIAEILEYSIISSSSKEKSLRFLRNAQLEALEVYWYLRLVEKTPCVFDLYKSYFSNENLLDTLNIKLSEDEWRGIALSGGGLSSVFERIKTDDEFVKKHRLEATRESLVLNYLSYIFALTMGAGKTILIGAIIATEFVMALEYPDANFVKNVLVFAPGKTILGALKEISDIPYEKVLPERLYKEFITSVKFTYTRDGEKDIPIIKSSLFNIIVTNTEKIRIRKESIRKSMLGSLFENRRKEEVKEFIANQRLQTIASLSNLAIFSDEAHHTYGQKLGKELKRVRQTVNYLAKSTNVLVVVNTTGTPYYKKQILKDVVYWYGLSQGIEDGILKEVRGNIIAYPEVRDDDFLKDVIMDFFKNYKDIKIYDSTPSRLSIYFPKIEDLVNAKPIIEKTLIEIRQEPSIILEVHSKSSEDMKDLFDNRINDPYLPYRIFLLVNKGTEGWNCPSLFATALSRKLSAGSNNFVLQAACRCLRQTPGNIHKAKIYLSKDNVSILDAQLSETYGESLQELNNAHQDVVTERVILRKIEIPPISLKKRIRKVIPVNNQINISQIKLQKPQYTKDEAAKIIYDLKEIPDRKSVLIVKKEEKFAVEEDFIDAYFLAIELSSLYKLPLIAIHQQLKDLYPKEEIPESHIPKIKEQIEKQIKNYKIIEEEVEEALALIKPEGFSKEEKNGKKIYTTEIIYHKDRAKELLISYEKFKKMNKKDFGFQYTPYLFDSKPEKNFFIWLLEIVNENPADVEDVYFTGGISDPKKTDIIFEYKGKDEKYHSYSPDFLIKKKNGRTVIVEIKAERFKDEAKEKQMREIEGLNPDKLKYEILETKGEQLTFEAFKKVREAIYEYGGK